MPNKRWKLSKSDFYCWSTVKTFDEKFFNFSFTIVNELSNDDQDALCDRNELPLDNVRFKKRFNFDAFALFLYCILKGHWTTTEKLIEFLTNGEIMVFFLNDFFWRFHTKFNNVSSTLKKISIFFQFNSVHEKDFLLKRQ